MRREERVGFVNVGLAMCNIGGRVRLSTQKKKPNPDRLANKRISVNNLFYLLRNLKMQNRFCVDTHTLTASRAILRNK